MRENRLKTIWSDGGVAIAAGAIVNSTYSAEMVARMGFDAVVIDTQHAPVDYQMMLGMLQAISQTPAVPIVRVPWNEPASIMRTLDAGAYAVIGPMINSRKDCEAFVGACYYAPKGYRSWGPVRGTMYGGPDYFERANDTILPLVQLETMESIERADEILSVPGVGGTYIGPGDLAITLGLKPGKSIDDPKLLSAIDRAYEACKRHKIPIGIATPNAEWAKTAVAKGAQLIWAGADTGWINSGGQAALGQFRKVAGRAE
jgi:4-hydroxy-2-oxoheptanedioate aldolase